MRRRKPRSGSLQTKLLLPLLIIGVTALAAHVALTFFAVRQATAIMAAAVWAGAILAYWLQVLLILRPLRALQVAMESRSDEDEGNGSPAKKQDEIDSLVEHLNHTLQTLALSEAHFRAIVNTAADGFITFGESGKVLWLNRAAQKIFGYEPQQAVGKQLRAFIPFSENSARHMQAVSTGEIRLFSPKREVEGFRFDGVRFPIELAVGKAQVGDRPTWIAVVHDLTNQKKAEEVLRLHALTFANISDAVLLTDMQGRILDINLAAEKMFNYGRDELLGKTAQTLHPDQAGPLTSQRLALSGKDGRWTGELEFLRHDGTLGVCETVVVSLKDENNNRVGTMRVCHDISERKRAEAELRQSQANLSALIENTSDAIWWEDPEGRLVTFNAAFRKLAAQFWGHEPAVGARPMSWLSEGDRPQWLANRKRVMAGERLTVEYHREQKGATHYWEVSHNPIRVGDVIMGVSTYARDITERKRAEEGRFIRKIAEASPHVMFVFNMPEKRIVYTNRQITGTLGYTPKEVEDMRSGFYPRLLHEEDLRRLPNVLQQWEKMADGQIVEAEYRMKATRGGWRWFLGRFTVFSRTPDGQVLEIIGVAQDITEHKRGEQELRAALTEKEALLKEVHHRVKNNLQIITSLLNLQAASIQDDATTSVFNETKNRVRSMALLHETLYRSADLARIDLPIYIDSLCSHLARSYGVDRGRVEMAIQVEPVTLDLDRALPCGLIINELVSNSFKYAFPEGRAGRVAVALRQEANKMYVLTVSDNGVGLPPDWDVRQSTSLGLRLVSDLTQQLRGTLHVERDGGAKFTITFPLGEITQHQ